MGLEIISKLKKERNLTNEELSKLSGVPKGTLDKILSGVTKDPKLGTLKALAKVLDCTLDDFDDSHSEEYIDPLFSNKYNKLDEKGKHTVNTVLDMEYNRCSVKDTKPVIHHLAAHADDEDNKELLKKDIDMITGDDW